MGTVVDLTTYRQWRGRDEVRHEMVVLKGEPGRGQRAFYWSQCLECDVYTSKYWDRKDCPLWHYERNNFL
jgi:hypothetical protein